MRLLLLFLTGIIALTASISGVMMMIIPDGSFLNLSPNLLETSPFNSFFIPGLILGAGVGGSSLVALCYLLARHKKQYNRSLLAGILITGWILVQMFLVQGPYWLQWLNLGCGIFIILLSYQLKGKWLA